MSALSRHDLLLRLSGRIDDRALTAARDRLAAGQTDDVDAFLAATWDRLAPVPQPLRAEEAEPGYGFAPAGPAALGQVGDRIGPTLDLTGGPDAELPGLADDVDADAGRAVAGIPGALGLWRAWRFPTEATPAMPLARVYLVEVDPTDHGQVALARSTGQLQLALHAAGVADPQVELYRTGQPLPAYQRAARAGAALLWARRPWHLVRLARTFDAGSPPRFAPGHPVLTDPGARQMLLDRLAGGVSLLRTVSRMDDVVAGGRGVVSVDLRTDGRWIWPEAIAYYLDRYGLAPDPELVGHLADAPAVPVDGVALHRAMVALST